MAGYGPFKAVRGFEKIVGAEGRERFASLAWSV